MSPLRRKYPHGEKELAGLDQDFWAVALDPSQKVAVYWPDTASSPTVVGYYESVSLANAAAASAVASNGSLPKIAINWAHPDISHIQVGVVAHPDAREDLPDWIDEEPAS